MFLRTENLIIDFIIDEQSFIIYHYNDLNFSIGHCGYFNGKFSGKQIGMCIGEKHQNKGYAVEVVNKILFYIPVEYRRAIIRDFHWSCQSAAHKAGFKLTKIINGDYVFEHPSLLAHKGFK